MASLVLVLMGSNSAMADQIISDDLIVIGSACVGIDCVVDTEFDFDTLQVKSSNPGINFVDTSSSSAFPTTDWSLGVASSQQQTSYLFIKDNSADTEVLKLSADETGGVAIGAGSEMVNNAVSVGSNDVKRRVTHVADGVNPTDAVNLGQLQALESTFEPKVSELETQMAELLNRVEALNSRLDDLQ